MLWVLMPVLKTPQFGILGSLSTAVILQVRTITMALLVMRSMFMTEIGLRWLAPMAISITVSITRGEPGPAVHSSPESLPAACGRRAAGLTYRAQMILSAAIPVGSRFGSGMQMELILHPAALRLSNRLRFM